MSAIENLRKRHQAHQKKTQAELDAKMQQQLDQFEQQVRERLPDDLLKELQAEFVYVNRDSRSGHPVCLLTYRGQTARFAWGGYYAQHRFGNHAESAIVEWIDDREKQIVEFEQKKRETRAGLLEMLPSCTSLREWEKREKQAEKYGLDKEEQIADLLTAARARIEASNAEWRRRRDEEERQREQEYEDQVQELIVLWNSLQAIEDFDRVYNLAQKYDYDVLHDARAREAEKRADARHDDLADQREERRLAAQAIAFHPWVYYQINYGIAIPGGDGESDIIKTSHFCSLYHVPCIDNFYNAIDKDRRIKPEHIIDIQEITVSNHDDQPSWSPTRETKHGIIHVPPVNARHP